LWTSGVLLGIAGVLSGLIGFTSNPIQGLVILAFGAFALAFCGALAIMVQSTYEAAVQARKTTKHLEEISALMATTLAPDAGADA
jgi:arginine exporter protein ArgO